MAYTPIYTRKNFVNGTAPAINATNLNDIEDALVSLGNGLQTAAADSDANTAAISTIEGEISDINDLIDAILPDDSESGNPAVITDAFAGECKSLVLVLEPIQSGSGTPSPSNPRPITGRTQSTTTRTGKNICSVNSGNNLIIARVKNGVTYTFSIRNRGNCGFNLKKESISGAVVATYIGSTDSVISVSFTADSDFNLFLNGYGIGGYTFVDSAYDYQLEIGPSATQYEAYSAESITRVYGETVYGVTDECTGAGATKTKGLYIPSVTSVGYSASAGCNYADCHNITIVEDSNTICNMYDQIPYGNTDAEGKYKVYPSAITIYDNRFTDVATAQAILNSCQIVYPLYTPVLIPLAPQNLTLLKGDNVITTDADNVEVGYKADIALYIAKQLGGNLGNRGAKSAPADEPADDPKEEEKSDEITEPVTKEAKK